MDVKNVFGKTGGKNLTNKVFYDRIREKRKDMCYDCLKYKRNIREKYKGKIEQ